MFRHWMLAVICFLSGASALAFEALWFHQAGLAFGHSVWASSLVLAGFMAGLATGNLLATRYGDRLRNVLKAYAALELVVALIGISLVYVLPTFGVVLAPLLASLAEQPLAQHALRLLVGFILLWLPSTAIGMTLPFAVRAIRGWDPSFGRSLGFLYGMNTLGGVAGILAIETWWLAAIGVHGSAWCAGGLAVSSASLAVFAGSLWNPGQQPATAPPPTRGPWIGGINPWLIAAFINGFCVLALEVVWLRFLVLFLNDTPLAFATILALVLVGIALGSLLAAAWARRSVQIAHHAHWVAFATGAFGLGGFLLYPHFLSGSLAARQDMLTVARVAAPLVLPTCVASGALFACLGAGLRASAHSDVHATGRLSFFNTLGATLGALAAGLWLLPHLGLERALWLLFALGGVAGMVLALRTQHGIWRRYGATLVFFASMAWFPSGEMEREYFRISAQRWQGPDDVTVDVRESLTATLFHVVHRHDGVPLYDRFATNAYSMTTNDFAARRYMKLFAVLPLALHPRLERALVVGFGLGNTAKALTDAPELSHLDIVDISTDMLEESRRLAIPLQPHPLDDPRVQVHLEDGRFFLQTTRQRYDLITAEPPPPILAGVGHLYTREHFRSMHDRLAEGGMATYWLPLMNVATPTVRGIIAAFCDAFADCSLWHGADMNLMLVGSRGGTGSVAPSHFGAQWQRPATRKELASLGLETPAQLAALFIGDAIFLHDLIQDAPPLTDSAPRRMQPSRSYAEGARFLERLQDPEAARRRFLRSPLITAWMPPSVRADAAEQFQAQRLLNHLLSPAAASARNAKNLHRILRSTQLELPVLLVLGSTPDHQRALMQLPPDRRAHPAWALHRAAAHLAERDMSGALEALQALPDAALPFADLRRYVAYAASRDAAQAGIDASP